MYTNIDDWESEYKPKRRKFQEFNNEGKTKPNHEFVHGKVLCHDCVNPQFHLDDKIDEESFNELAHGEKVCHDCEFHSKHIFRPQDCGGECLFTTLMPEIGCQYPQFCTCTFNSLCCWGKKINLSKQHPLPTDDPDTIAKWETYWKMEHADYIGCGIPKWVKRLLVSSKLLGAFKIPIAIKNMPTY